MSVGDYVTENGLVLPNLTDVMADVSDQQKAAIDPNLDTSPESPIGQFNGIFLAALRDAFETLTIAYNGFNPDAAEDFLLEGTAAITGTIRAAATFSRFTLLTEQTGKKLKLTLEANKTVSAGTIIAQEGNTQVQFVTTEDVSSTTAGDYYAAARCAVTGPVACNAGTLTVIQTPVSGLTAVTNEFDAILGRNVDTDEELRARRVDELHGQGTSAVDAVASLLAAIELPDGSKPIQDVSVVENATDYPDALGRPPHCIEAIIYDGEGLDCPNDTIAQVLWDAHAGGIRTYGMTTGIAVDKNGADQLMHFNRPALRPIKIQIDLTAGPDYAGDDLVKSAIESIFLATRQRMGVANRAIEALLFAAILDRSNLTDNLGSGVKGVTRISSIKIQFVGSSYPASYVDLAINPRDLPTLDTSDIEIL